MRAVGVWEIFVSGLLFCCKPKTGLKNKVSFKKKHTCICIELFVFFLFIFKDFNLYLMGFLNKGKWKVRDIIPSIINLCPYL